VETSDHYKNGATPKSQTSRKIKNNKMKKLLIVSILLITFGSINAQCPVYSGTGYSAKQIGYFDGGKIYSGTGYSAKQIGYIEGEKIFSGTGYSAKQVGYFEAGKIYSGTGYSAKQVGYFEAGKIYSGTGYSAKQVGYIESGGGGCSAAASFLLLL